ncbi:DUF2231 domain-containing protein [Nocardioides stalactiti]|uniref:DUF2231 domain-containing protein n=1 Tax=Nocardioides stalactiti TaxID=2755356 RepID=UPI0016048237|nr:DUF2231 domain-containing protein [Nocardioides stalactiti]
MEINGLPLHPLAVHGAVVLVPLVALLALAYLLPKWHDQLRWPLLVGALVAVGSVVVAYLSGDSFREANEFFNTAGPIADKIDTHEERAELLLWTSISFGVMALLNAVLHPKEGWLRWVLGALLAIDAVAVLVLVIMTGDAGAQAVWGEGFKG